MLSFLELGAAGAGGHWEVLDWPQQ